MTGCKNLHYSFMIGIRMVKDETDIAPVATFFSHKAKGYAWIFSAECSIN